MRLDRSRIRTVAGGLLAGLLLLAGCRSEDPVVQGPPSPTVTATAPTPEPPDPGDAPGRLVAVLADGRLVLADAAGGELVRTLAEDVPVDDPAKNGIALSADRSAVYVVRPDRQDLPRTAIERIDIATGEAESVASGLAPAVSPDGSTLAYVALEPGDELPVPVIVLRDLGTGDERTLRHVTGEPFPFVAQLEWTPAGELVVVAGELFVSVYLVDPQADDLDGARRLGPTARGEGVSWPTAAAFDGERLAVAETCCDVPDAERALVLAVHIETGSVEGGLLPVERVDAFRIARDASTRHLLIVADLTLDGGRLQRWSPPADGENEAAPETLREDVIVAAW